ncbi:TPA: hypothetical protein HA259_05980 [Thermoplasmata archaeon]|nr:hypothetical protein [Thermoplasmata archaeon]
MTSRIEAVHLLTTYRCERECDHCFVWAGPSQLLTMPMGFIREVLSQAQESEGVKMIYFEGGEPFMYYSTLLEGAKLARSMGFDVGIVTNGYWGVTVEDALLSLRPFAELGVSDLSVSDDEYHRMSEDDLRARNVVVAAEQLGIPVGVLKVCRPGTDSEDGGQMYFRGRASEKIAPEHCTRDPAGLTSCPEDLASPSRVHVDPLGLVHVCQGIVVGDVRAHRLVDILEGYDHSKDPVLSALVNGGPAALVQRLGLELPIEKFADDCHLCYVARESLRARFPQLLGPDEMYGCESREPSE